MMLTEANVTNSDSLYLNFFKATKQQENYFQLQLISRMNCSVQTSFIFGILLRNHAYSQKLQRIQVGKSKRWVAPEPFQISVSKATISQLSGISYSSVCRAFTDLVKLGFLEYKKTAAGYKAYFLDPLECQIMLEYWEKEDGLYEGKPNYTLITIKKTRTKIVEDKLQRIKNCPVRGKV
jgi:hypothetical protein